MATQSAHSLIVSFHPVDHKVKFRFPWWILTESVGVPSLCEGFVCSDHLQPGICWGFLFGHFIIKGQHFADENIQLPAITRYRVKNRKGHDRYQFYWLQQVIGREKTLARGTLLCDKQKFAVLKLHFHFYQIKCTNIWNLAALSSLLNQWTFFSLALAFYMLRETGRRGNINDVELSRGK